MTPNDLVYAELKKMLSRYAGKGRSESASFLNWFLENIYRLSDVDADDAICDEVNDKGIDGIYVDNTAQEIHFFQSKISQRDGRTIGDRDLKNFVGSIDQFRTPESIDLILNGNANQDLKKLINRTNLKQLLIDGYKLVGIFVANQDPDDNCREYIAHRDDIVIYDRDKIALEYIDFDADEGVRGQFEFDVSYAGCLQVEADDGMKIFMFPAKALELIKLKGIADTTLFKQNVRLTLGNTAVNKSIAKSISERSEHRNFPLYHNGITILCSSGELIGDALRVQDYVVVNGAQSISTFYKNSSSLSDDLRVFVKVIALRNDELARKITINSNNQNSIKARDLRSNHIIMLRLKAEFEKDQPEYSFEIKRGEETPEKKISITNEDAGRLLMAFDLNEPHSCHQVYKVFDEKYADIFGRPEVTASRVVFLHELFELIGKQIGDLKNEQMGGYALTKFFILNVLRHIMEMSPASKEIITSRSGLDSAENRDRLLKQAPAVIGDIVVDFNYEIQEDGDTLDYKADLKSPERTRSWRNKLLSSYEKELKKGKAAKFE
ncbi:AIPR family protein [Rhizobium sp. CB3090]|uniref:AIPR family protein n=1 Tax=Rhizobium sp. CB3090 TaxID=3039156 RepID=UPI0024B23A8A|nr:AIPR family protein [Rhizobium sp. CB3090]WFU08343.1 AIPR family protein [Rhizobium sp. CB3090]